MIGEIAFGEPMGFENSARLMPAIGRTAPLLPGPNGPLLRTHEPYRGEYARAVYVVRHAADVAVSYYNHLAWKGVQAIGFKEFLRLFLVGRIDGYGTWSAHVRSWLDAPEGAIHVIRYEDLRRDTPSALMDVCGFLEIEFTADAIGIAIEGNSLDAMRSKQDIARSQLFADRPGDRDFVREGRVGESTTWLDDEDFALVERHAGDALKRLGYDLRPVAS